METYFGDSCNLDEPMNMTVYVYGYQISFAEYRPTGYCNMVVVVVLSSLYAHDPIMTKNLTIL